MIKQGSQGILNAMFCFECTRFTNKMLTHSFLQLEEAKGLVKSLL